MVFKDIIHLVITVFPYIQLPNNWKDMIIIVEGCSHEMKISPVTWIRPPINTYKLNIDVSAIDNPGKIGGGEILRDHQGVMIHAFTVPLGIGTNNQA